MKDHVTTTSPCDLASMYSLGALDDDEALLFEAHLLDGCPACDADLAGNMTVVGLLGFAAEPMAPPAGLRDQILQSTSIRETDEIGRLAQTGDWRPHEVPGVTTRTLHLDRASRTILMLVRAEGGALYPTHRHAGVEEMFMLYGDLEFREKRYKGGDYIRSEPGTIHESGMTANGCMFLIRTSLDDEILTVGDADDDSGRVSTR